MTTYTIKINVSPLNCGRHYDGPVCTVLVWCTWGVKTLHIILVYLKVMLVFKLSANNLPSSAHI